MEGAITKEGLVRFCRMMYWRPITAVTTLLWGGNVSYRYTLTDALTMQPCGFYYETVFKDASVCWNIKLDHTGYQTTTTGGYAEKHRKFNAKCRALSVSLFGY